MTRREAGEVAIATAVAAMVLVDASRLDSSVYNNYVRLADAFLHGHVWVYWPGDFIDAVGYHGRHYVIEGPVPALLMMPLVAVWGLHANQTLFACATAAFATGGAWLVARRLGAGMGIASATTAFFTIGTPLLWCAIYGAVWYVAHTVSVMFAIFAVAELVGKRRAWLLALLVCLAAGSRFTLILALPPLLIYALAPLRGRAAVWGYASSAVVLVASAALFVAYNEARWGLPNDIGYITWYHRDPIGYPYGPPFRLEFFTYELAAFFATLPALVNKYPWVIPSYGAVSIEVTSPAFVLAFFARAPRGLIVCSWLATALVAIPSFFYYANGGTQWGMRHMLDFLPFAFPLVVLGARRAWPWASYALCGLSVAVGIWGMWYWRMFYDSYLVHKGYGL